MKAPFAEWRGPLPGSNYAPGQMGTVIGVTVHHMDGSFASADASFHNPDRGASAHFGISYDGHVVQWVDTADVAYHACRANWTGWVGIENESDPDRPDGPPTGAQIESMGAIIRWLGVPAVPASSPTSGGVGYHRQFPGACNAAWGQTACPGQGFIDNIPAICAAAGGTGDIVTEDQMNTLGTWMKQQRQLEQDTIGQWLKDVEGRLKAYIDSKVTAPGGGVTADQVQQIVRSELNKTKLGN